MDKKTKINIENLAYTLKLDFDNCQELSIVFGLNAIAKAMISAKTPQFMVKEINDFNKELIKSLHDLIIMATQEA